VYNWLEKNGEPTAKLFALSSCCDGTGPAIGVPAAGAGVYVVAVIDGRETSAALLFAFIILCDAVIACCASFLCCCCCCCDDVDDEASCCCCCCCCSACAKKGFVGTLPCDIFQIFRLIYNKGMRVFRLIESTTRMSAKISPRIFFSFSYVMRVFICATHTRESVCFFVVMFLT